MCVDASQAKYDFHFKLQAVLESLVHIQLWEGKNGKKSNNNNNNNLFRVFIMIYGFLKIISSNPILLIYFFPAVIPPQSILEDNHYESKALFHV